MFRNTIHRNLDRFSNTTVYDDHSGRVATCLPVYLSTCLPVYLSSCLPVYLSTCIPVHPVSICLFVKCLSVCFPVSICLPVFLSFFPVSTFLLVHFSLFHNSQFLKELLVRVKADALKMINFHIYNINKIKISALT